MKQIIKINNQNNQFPVDARELHRKLKTGARFNDWIRRRILEYDFIKNEDFLLLKNEYLQNQALTKKQKQALNFRLDYFLTLDMAKELAMLENNETGRSIRRYFIQVEKAYREGPFGELARRTVDARTYIDYNGVLNLLQLSLRSGSYHRRIRRYRSEFMKINNRWYVSVEFSRVIWQQTEVIKQRNKAALKTLEATIAEATQRHNALKARQLEINLQ